MSSASHVAQDVDALVREITPGAFVALGSGAAVGGGGSSQALAAEDCSLGACGVLLVTITPGFGGSEQQLRCLHTVLAAAAVAGGAPV